MKNTLRYRLLRIFLVVAGVLFIFGVYPLMIVWPSGWIWQPDGHSDYEQMMVGIYATLGIFLIKASRNPDAHRSLISFTVWSSFVHGGIMGVQAIADPLDRGHLLGDVPFLLAVAIALAVVIPKKSKNKS